MYCFKSSTVEMGEYLAKCEVEVSGNALLFREVLMVKIDY